MTITILTIIHVIVCFFLVCIVLLQHGKGADMGAAFGGSGSTMFGAEGPMPLLNKITTGSAIIFMVTSISLAYFTGMSGSKSVMSGIKAHEPVTAEQPVAKPVEQPPETVPLPAEDTGETIDVAPQGVKPAESTTKLPENNTGIKPVQQAAKVEPKAEPSPKDKTEPKAEPAPAKP